MPDTTADRLAALRTVTTRIVRTATGLHEPLAYTVADEIVRELQRQFGGTALHIPATAAGDRYRQLAEAYHLGEPIDSICRRFACHRATVYRAVKANQASAASCSAD